MRNLILITIDALRADHLSCYGYKEETSPNIDELAKKGLFFTNANSVYGSTLGSFTSMFSATYPSMYNSLSLHERPSFVEVLRQKRL